MVFFVEYRDIEFDDVYTRAKLRRSRRWKLRG
jgi:hypothetical protein